MAISIDVGFNRVAAQPRNRVSDMKRLLTAIGMAIIVVGILVGPAAADTEMGKAGRVGVRWLNEPGALCDYHYFVGDLYQWTVNPPVVYARDVSSGRDAQIVGWRVVIKRWYQGAVKTRFRTHIAKATAYDDAAARFNFRTMQPEEFASGLNDYYFAVIKLYWYDSSGQLVGRDSRRIDSYVNRIANSDEDTYRSYVRDRCTGYWVEPA